jgi:phosphate-selective porin
VKTLIGFGLGSLLSLGMVTSALAAGTSVTAPARSLDDGVEVIVVTAKRPAAQPVADEPIEVIVVTAKRPTQTNAERTPPAMPIVMPKLELAAEPLVIRL